MVTGWQTLYDYKYECIHWFYFNEKGEQLLGWQKIGADYYYFSPDNGYMYYYGWYDIDGKSYWFKPTGQMITGWYHFNGEDMMDGYPGFTLWAYCDSDGQGHNGWLYDGGYWYYLENGEMFYGMWYIDEVLYAFDLDGRMLADQFVTPYDFDRSEFNATNPYHFDADGKGSNGWVWYDGNTRYYYVNGESHIKETRY